MKTLKQAFGPLTNNTIRVIAQGEKGRTVIECEQNENIGQEILKTIYNHMLKESA